MSGFLRTELDIFAALATGERSFSDEDFADWDEEGGYRYTEWNSPDKKRSLFLSLGYGPEYGNRFLLDVTSGYRSQYTRGKFGILRVQAVVEPTNEIAYNVYLDTLDPSLSQHEVTLPQAAYYASQGGKLVSGKSIAMPSRAPRYSGWSQPQFFEAYYTDLQQAGAFFRKELPDQIDLPATVEAFMAQMRNGDFGKPRMVPVSR